MSDTQAAPIDNATQTVAASPTVAPPSQASEQPGSTPAPVETTANGQEGKGQEPDRQSRRESRAFANQRREIRELHRQLGYMQAQMESFRAPAGQQTPEGEQPQQRQTRAPTPTDAAQDELNRSIMDRIADEGEEYEEVVEKITASDFPGTVLMRDFLAESEKPAEMAKWLADNPKEARRISLLSDPLALRALEKAEASLAKKPAPKTTTAPPPVPTVGGRSAPSFDPEKASMDEYAAHWKSRQAKR